MQVEPKFRLPNYIAIRFNLRITHVHRGLLLGTGPLVDPGFEGDLLIPLHNLTSSPYDMNTNDALIWIEFTKTTYDFQPTEEYSTKVRNFRPFPDDKKNLTADYYLRKANSGYPIRSSIPDAIEQGRQDAANSAASAGRAEQTVLRLRNWLAGFGVVALAALVIGLFTLWFQVAGMVQNSNSLTMAVEQELASIAAEGKVTADRLSAAQIEIAQLRQQLSGLVGEFGKFRSSSGPALAPAPLGETERR